jgi:integrase
MPLLGETGCRLAEIVGLKLEDIDLENDLIHIRPNSARRLKDEEQPENLALSWICQAGYEASTEAGRRYLPIPKIY